MRATSTGKPGPTRSASRPPAELRGLMALVAGSVCIGFAPIWVRASEVGPVATAFFRLALALPIIAVWSARERGPSLAVSSPQTLWWALAAGAFFAFDLAAWHVSIKLTSVANSTLLANVAPVFVTAGAWLFLRERVGRNFYAGLALALGGAWFLTGASFRADPSHLRGDLMALLTAVFYGAYQLSVARLRRDTGPGKVLFWSSMTSTPILLGIAAILGESLWPTTAWGWAMLLGLAITCQVLGQGLITYGFAHLPASHSSLTLLLHPLVAALAAWGILGEPLSVIQAIGGCILLTGIVVARRRPPSRIADVSAGGSQHPD